MTIAKKLEAGSAFPPFTWPQTDGDEVTPAIGSDWRLLIVYRGAHCPLCVKYLHDLSGLREKFDELGIRLWAISADPLERATEQARQEGWRLPVLAELKESEMRDLGLYISTPRSPSETDRNFAEPGVFVITPEGAVQVIDVSNAPFARPDPQGLLRGLHYIIQNGYPIRGTG